MIPVLVPKQPAKTTSLQEQLKLFVLQLPLKSIFQRLPSFLCMFILPYSIFGLVYTPIGYIVYFSILHILLVQQQIRTCYAVYQGYREAVKTSFTDYLQEYLKITSTINGQDTRHDLPFDHVVHVIIIPNYKEDYFTLCETLDCLASHERALTQYRICLAMEETEVNCEKKAEQLLDCYKAKFFDIRYTVHPKGLQGEIRGKSSNVAWASVQMARLSQRHSHEIITVMDADTGFAQDYFEAINYHYCIASPSERNIMMFCPASVFDRNAKDVPLFVRVTDMFWSIGLMSNMYPTSPVKIPSSAYSVSMNLAVGVKFWDAGPEAIGEDMHMYLKCFFNTQGKVIVKSIYSPISSCNIEGKGTGFQGYMSGLAARYTQAKRHLWGSLDTGYVFCRSLLSVVAPETQCTIQVKNQAAYPVSKDHAVVNTLSLKLMLDLWQRMLEAHVLMGQFFPMLVISSLIIPNSPTEMFGLKQYLWSFISDSEPHPFLPYCLFILSWVRAFGILPTFVTWYFYEKYHQWVGFDRWSLALNPNSGVHPLGRRPQLQSPRTKWNLWDWILSGPAGFLFYVVPMFHAQISHLWTEELDYKVAGKPMLNRVEEVVV